MKKLILAIWTLLLSLSPLQSHIMEPNAPISNFKLPMFNQEGYKAWELRGDEGLFLRDETIQVEKMVLDIFSGDNTFLKETTITSPSATIDPHHSTAYSKHFIDINGSNYAVTGKDWSWNGETHLIEIQKDVMVTFSPNQS